MAGDSPFASAVKQAPGRHRQWAFAVAIVVLVVAAQYFGFWSALTEHVAAAVDDLRRAAWGWLVLAAATGLSSMGAYARMQHVLLRTGGVAVPLKDVRALTFAAHSLSVTVPGGAIPSTTFNFRRMRSMGAPPLVASWVITLSGVFSSAALVVLGLAAAAFAGGALNPYPVAGYAALVLGVGLAARVARRHPATATQLVGKIAQRASRAVGRDPVRDRDRVLGFIRDLARIRIPASAVGTTALLALTNWLLDAACFYLCAVAVGASDVSMGPFLLAYVAGMVATSITVVPGGLGIIDAALVLGLIAADVHPTQAVAATVLYRIITLGLVVGLGWMSWLLTDSNRSQAPAIPLD